MFDLIQHLKCHNPIIVLPFDFSSEHEEPEFDVSDEELFADGFKKIELNDEPFEWSIQPIPTTKSLLEMGGYFNHPVVTPQAFRFSKGTHHRTKLVTALEKTGNSHLVDTTLLCTKVSKEHADDIYESLCRRAGKIDQRETDKHAKLRSRNGKPYRRGKKRIKFFSTYESFKFLTIVHSVVHLCEAEAVQSVGKMMYQLEEAFKQVSGVSCLGAAECEIISRKMMRKVRAHKIANEKSQIVFKHGSISEENRKTIEKEIENQESRKLDVCEGLSIDNDASLYANDESEILIHFHGVVCAPSEAKFDELLKVLKKNPKWGIQPRQIEIKALTKQYGNKVKSVTDNFRDISDYIVKGGNDWIGKRPYLRYKLRFTNGMAMSEKEIFNEIDSTDQLLRQDIKDLSGVEDMLSLSINEIDVLAKTIDRMMALKENRLGYRFKCGRW